MSTLAEFRKQKDHYLGSAPDSPIGDATGFDGLDYYEENPSLALELELIPGDGSDVRVQTSDGQERVYTREAHISFEIDGAEVSLTLYGTNHNDGYFLPFRDATSGKETYGAGRFMDIEPAAEGKVRVDFNLAYNPYCAYDDGYSCPLPPAENWLTVPIPAGEKTYAKG
jgi:uncharacterized protein (DUF1684 family)